MRTIVIAAILASLAHDTAAALPVQRFFCVFERYVSPKTNGLSYSDPLRVEFVVDGTGAAFAVGKNVYPVRLVTGDLGVTFLEELGTGAVQSTTILPSGSAVHSRHTIVSIMNEIVPSQYYGTCKYSN